METELTDINIDCLESIFLHLNLPELLNLASSNKRLQKVAELVFIRKFRNKSVNIQNIGVSSGRRLYVYRDVILIMDFKTALQFLRCFGHLISSLSFDFQRPYAINQDRYTELNDCVISYINQYCAESLTSMSLINSPKDGLNYLDRTFSKVQNVYILNCHLEPNWMKTVLPNMRTIKYHDTKHKNVNLACIAHHFHQLEHFECGVSNDTAADFRREYMAAALYLNPQLKSFNGMLFSSTIFDVNFYKTMNPYLQQLDFLGVGWEIKDFFDYHGEPLHFKNVKRFELFLQFSHFEQLPRIPFSFDRLEEFAISLVQVNSAFYEFVRKHPKITKLKITPLWGMNDLDDAKLAEVLPLLREIDLTFYELSTRQAVGFIEKFKFLKKFCFHSKSKYVNQLRQRLGDEWQITIREENLVQMTRRN